jgi:ankyrin repeat protein
MRVGVNVDYRDRSGATALMHAMAKNNYEVVKLLLKNGASPWSSEQCKIWRLVEGCENRMRLLIKNARRIHLGQELKSRIRDKV